MSKVCKKCGYMYDETAGGCPNCNKKELILNRAEHRDDDLSELDGGIKRELYVPTPKKHRFKRILPFLLALLLLLGIIAGIVFGIKSCSDGVKSKGYLYVPKKEFLKTDEDTGIMYMNNIVILFLEEGTPKKEAERLADSINGKIVGELPVIDQYQIEIPESTLSDLQDICLNLEKEDVVVKATYDTAFYLAEETVTPEDPWSGGLSLAGEKWDESEPDGNNWWLEAIHAPSAWEYNNQLANSKVGVIDDGFDLSHEDLKNVIKSADDHTDVTDHGTHVAGIIGAEANNKKGITGIVWDCDLYTCDWMLNNEQLAELAEEGYGWNTVNAMLGSATILVEEGAKTVNLSAGLVVSGKSLPSDVVYSQGNQASTYLAQLLERDYDFVIVQSAGNGNTNGESIDALYNGLFCSITENNCFTSSNVTAKDIIDRVIVVGAAKNDGNNNYSQFYWSNAGDRVDICAPGAVYSTVPGDISGAYAELQGTSMSAPVVTAVAAMAWSANENLTGAQVKEILCDEANTRYEVADNPDSRHSFTNTYRMVDAELSVKAAIALKNEKATPKPVNPPDDEVCDYSEIIKQYRLAIKNDFYENGGSGAKNYLSKTLLDNAIYDIHNNNDVHVYYALYDINKDGMSECIIGAESDYFVQYDLFTYDGNKPVRLFSVDEYGGEAKMMIYDNGVVHVVIDAEIHSYYELKSGGTRLRALKEDGNYESSEINLDWEEISYKEAERVTSDERDIVLVLDYSGSMEGDPLDETKKSAIKFVNKVFDDELHASIGVVTYDDKAYMAADFTDDRYYLEEAIEMSEGGGQTNIEEALELANDMLDGSRAKKKAIVLMSDGVPNYGKTGDNLVDLADDIKGDDIEDDDIYIYTLGFFNNLGNEKPEAQELMERLASIGCHYEVDDSDELVFFFGDIADQLNGEKYIYIRIACPVDVEVTYGGEMLSSEEGKSMRTSFGTLTFEENPNETSSDDKIKVLRLKETGDEYNVSIVGTADGTMNYTIAFMDDEGKYSDVREFKDIAINDVTKIDTVAVRADKTTLKVDNDGDEKYELVYEAEENSEGKLKKSPLLIYIIVGVVGFILLAGIVVLVIILIVKGNKNRPGGSSYSGGGSFGDELNPHRNSPYSSGGMSGRTGDKGSFL